MSTDDRPSDLVGVREAARLVDRTPATVRAWVRSGTLRVWRGEGTHPANAPALVSRAELLHVAGVTGKVPNPPRPASSSRTEPPASAVELAALRAQLDAARVVALAREETAEALRATVAAVEARCRDLADAVERERARAASAEAERDALRTSAGLPWWRRLFGAPAALPGPGDGDT